MTPTSPGQVYLRESTPSHPSDMLWHATLVDENGYFYLSFNGKYLGTKSGKLDPWDYLMN